MIWKEIYFSKILFCYLIYFKKCAIIIVSNNIGDLSSRMSQSTKLLYQIVHYLIFFWVFKGTKVILGKNRKKNNEKHIKTSISFLINYRRNYSYQLRMSFHSNLNSDEESSATRVFRSSMTICYSPGSSSMASRYTSDTITRFRDEAFSIDRWPLRRDECAVRDVVTVVRVLLPWWLVPKQWFEFEGQRPENHESACMFLSDIRRFWS